MSCVNCTCAKCRRDAVAFMVRERGQVWTAAVLHVSQSTISRHLNRVTQLSPETLRYAKIAAWLQSMGVEECVARYGFAVGSEPMNHVTRAALGWLHEDAIREDARRSAARSQQSGLSREG